MKHHWCEQVMFHSELPSINLTKFYSDFDQKLLNFWLAACNSTEGGVKNRKMSTSKLKKKFEQLS